MSTRSEHFHTTSHTGTGTGIDAGTDAGTGTETDTGTGRAPVTQAVILAGGTGSRLRPYTDTRPKTMVEIPGTGRTILEHQLDWLAAEGVTDVVVSCGHLAEVLQDWLAATDLPTRVETIVEDEPLGRGGGLRYASTALPHPDEDWYALNSDIWTRFPLHAMALLHRDTKALATLALARPRIPWGVVKLDESGDGALITDFMEAPATPWPVNAGVYVFAPEFTPLLPEVGDHERTTFPDLARRRRLIGYPIPEGVYWRAIDTVKDLENAARELAALEEKERVQEKRRGSLEKEQGTDSLGGADR